MKRVLLPILMIFLFLIGIPFVHSAQPTSPPGQADQIFLPHSTLIINNGTMYDITEYISNYYQNITYLDETIIYNIDNRTLTTVVNNITNVYPEYNYQTFNRYYITNYNVDLGPVLQQIAELRIEIADIDADLDRDEGIIALLILAFLALCGGVIYHVGFTDHHRHLDTTPKYWKEVESVQP